jgi:Flp pilus assembly protein CpaB
VAVSAQRRRRVLVAVVAAAIAAGAFYLAIEYTNKPAATGSTSATTTPTMPVIATENVVVPSTSIAAGTLLTASNLKTTAVATEVVTLYTEAGAGSVYTTLASVTATKEYAALSLPAGVPLLSGEVTATPTSANPQVAGLPAVLPAGYVAVSLPYAPGAASGSGDGTGGYIQALDRIDILVNEAAGGPVYWAYENVLVLAVGQETGGQAVTAVASPAASASASSAPTVTGALIMVELPREDAAALTQIEDTSGASIQYLVVSSDDYPSASASPGPAATAPASTVTNPNQFFAG